MGVVGSTSTDPPAWSSTPSPRRATSSPTSSTRAPPAPALAPEERLESQQQVRRRGDTGGGYGRRGKAPVMSATGGPVSTTWDDDDGEDGYFQPESFMFLGPGAYNDVSPMVDDDAQSVASRSREEGCVACGVQGISRCRVGPGGIAAGQLDIYAPVVHRHARRHPEARSIQARCEPRRARRRHNPAKHSCAR